MANRWLDRIVDGPLMSRIVGQVDAHARLVLTGSFGSSTHLLAGGLCLRARRPVLLVVAHLDESDDALEDMALFDSPDRPLEARRFAALEVLPGESNVSLELLAQRLSVIRQLHDAAARGQDFRGLIVAPIQALMQAVPKADALDGFQLTLRAGTELPPAQLLDWLDRAGYQRNDAIEHPGDFATRGGIIDLYPPAASSDRDDQRNLGPIRVDYFGDEIESIRQIDADTMGSGDKLDVVHIVGAGLDTFQNDNDTVDLLSLLPGDTLVVMHEVMELAEQARGYYERLTNPRGIYAPQTIFKKLNAMPHVEVNQYSAVSDKDTSIALPLSPLAGFAQEVGAAMVELTTLAQADDLAGVRVFCEKQAEADRLVELLAEHAADVTIGENSRLSIDIGYLHRGFVWREDESSPGLLLVGHHEIFHRYHTRRRVRKIGAQAASSRASDAFLDLNVGDYVVHVDHGIARFAGLRTMTRGGRNEEYLTLEFANDALLHVPASQIEQVQKYVGGFEGKPPLSLLGGKRWAKQKEAATEAAKDLAKQMLQVQAARASMPGIRYPADTTWQKEFEAEFPYDETPDQLAAIHETKKSMGDQQPMDRLICGDVGFGKTEVAMRAAFKAIEFGKQVAVLVPTTVLAEQHERTFRERMAAYPFNIVSISRFKTGKMQKQTLEQLRQGQVDVIIGTHRLLSQDVKFADLGLVIIDEEQRFGVEHKHKLLSFRLTADVLTLSATPIPRTLHMAMLGLRDISSLSTPPVDRRAIVTEVIPYNEKRIQQAIVRELNRDGQVYFVHNRVHNIQSVADDIKRLVPEAKIIIGHGQMSGHELEKVMLKFIRRQANVLVCTTIIESGIDIPTANTMFINQADHFGLAELHQLRGRVGRYKHRAYCYLLLPPGRNITDVAARRLKAIEQYAMLGAGFKIAMRDLEIRGAGNLLGAEQSGHIAAVGYEMYCTLLENEARKLKVDGPPELMHTHIDLPISGRIDKRYIASDKYRMEAYRRLARAATLEEYDHVVKDLVDAYGPMPKAAAKMVELAEVRIAASMHEIISIKLDGPDLIFKARKPGKLEPLFKDAPGRTTLIDQDSVYYRPPSQYMEPDTLLAVLRKLLVRPLREPVAQAS